MRSSLSAFRSLSRVTTNARTFRPSVMTSTRPTNITVHSATTRPLSLFRPILPRPLFQTRAFSSLPETDKSVDTVVHTQQMKTIEAFAKLGTASVAGVTLVLLGNNLGAIIVGCVTVVFVVDIIKDGIETSIIYESMPVEKREQMMETELKRHRQRHEKSS